MDSDGSGATPQPNPSRRLVIWRSPCRMSLGPRLMASMDGQAFIRAEAYLRQCDGVKAAAEFQKLLDHRSIDPVDMIFPLSRLGLARAYVIQGDRPVPHTRISLASGKMQSPICPS
jgi:hypothetical protein